MKKTTLTLPSDDAQVLASRLGYSNIQNLLDDLAMGLIPATAAPVAPPMAMPTVEGSGKSAPVAQSKSKDKKPIDKLPESPENPKPLSWASEAEEEEVAVNGAAQSEIQQPKPKEWKDVVKDNGPPDSVGSLEYIMAGPTVTFSKEEWEEGKSLWKHAIVGAFLDFKPSHADVIHWVEVNWKSYQPRVSHIKPGVYLFDFKSEADKLAVLGRDWSFYHKSSIALRDWNPDMDIDSMAFNTRRMWIQLPKLNYRFWSRKNLSKLASYIGVPIVMDRLTTSSSRLSFARILVEVSVDAELPDFIPVTHLDGFESQQALIYEHTLPKSSRCGFIGHSINECRKKDKPIQQEKPIVPAIVETKTMQVASQIDVTSAGEKTESMAPGPLGKVIEKAGNADKPSSSNVKQDIQKKGQPTQGSGGNNAGISLSNKQSADAKSSDITSHGKKASPAGGGKANNGNNSAKKRGNQTIMPNG